MPPFPKRRPKTSRPTKRKPGTTPPATTRDATRLDRVARPSPSARTRFFLVLTELADQPQAPTASAPGGSPPEPSAAAVPLTVPTPASAPDLHALDYPPRQDLPPDEPEEPEDPNASSSEKVEPIAKAVPTKPPEASQRPSREAAAAKDVDSQSTWRPRVSRTLPWPADRATGGES